MVAKDKRLANIQAILWHIKPQPISVCGETIPAERVQDAILEARNIVGKYEELERRYSRCKNELCLRCGDYRDAHVGACDGCFFKEG